MIYKVLDSYKSHMGTGKSHMGTDKSHIGTESYI